MQGQAHFAAWHHDTHISYGQVVVDSCFSSINPLTGFSVGPDISNMGSNEADVIEWTGTKWVGGWPATNLTIPPPTHAVGCRALFIGNALTWTSGGEGFCLRLDAPMVVGQSYSYTFNYVSHGFGSNGAFSPKIYSNAIPDYHLGYALGRLPAVGYDWESNTVSFTATPDQAGHTWLILTTATDGTSGLINSFCDACNECSVNLGNDTTLCQGSTLVLDASLINATYIWQDNSTAYNFTVSQPGRYFVTATKDHCTATDTIEVHYRTTPLINLGNDTTLCQGDALVLNASVMQGRYLWQDQSTHATYTVTQAGTYSVNVMATCIGQFSIRVNYIDCQRAIDIPNVITPNDDGLNDTWQIKNIHDYKNASLFIYNRWGNIVWQSRGYRNPWDGTNDRNGQQLPDGTYFYILDVMSDSNESRYSGYVQIVK